MKLMNILVWLCLIGGAWGACWSTKVQAQASEGIVVPYAADNAFIAFVFQPKQFADDVDSKTLEELAELIEEFSSLRLDRSDQIHLQFELLEDFRPEFSFSVNCQLDSLVHPEDVIEGLFGGSSFDIEPEDYEGKKIYKTEREDGPCFFFRDPHTAALGMEPTIRQLMEDRDTGSTIELFHKLELNSDIGFVIDFSDKEGCQNFFEEAFRWQQEFGEDEIEWLLKIDRAYLSVHFERDQVIQGQVETASLEVAQEVAEGIGQSINAVREMMEQGIESMENRSEDMAEVTVTMLKQFVSALENVKLTVEGENVVVQVTREGGSQDILESVIRVMTEGTRMILEFR